MRIPPAWRRLVPWLLLPAAAYLLGLGWGLPSRERAWRVLSAGQRSDAFYRALEENRRGLYRRIGRSLQAAYGSGEWSGTLLPPAEGFRALRHPPSEAPDPVLLHGYSSFLLRSVEQDEQFVLNSLSRFRPRRLEFDPGQTLYGGAYIYPAAAWLAAGHVLGLLSLVPDALFYYRDPAELARLYLAGRLLSALAALGSLLLLFDIGRRLYDERTAFWGAALLGLSPGAAAFAHVLKPHWPAAFLTLAALRAALAAGRPRDWAAAAALFGLAVGAAKSCAIAALPLALLYARGRRDWRSPRGAAILAGLGALSVAVFFAVNPYALADWGDFLGEMAATRAWYRPAPDPVAVWELALVPLRLGLGTAAWALGLLGAARALFRPRGSDRLLAALALPWLVVSAFQMNAAADSPPTFRVLLAPAGLLALLGARWALEALGPRRGPAVLAAALALGAARSALLVLNYSLDRPDRSNAFAAGRWLEENLPAGAELGLDTPAPMADRFPPLAFSRFTLVSLEGPLPAEGGELPLHFAGHGLRAVNPPHGLGGRYEPVKTFDSMSWAGPFGRDPFTSANFPVTILLRKG